MTEINQPIPVIHSPDFQEQSVVLPTLFDAENINHSSVQSAVDPVEGSFSEKLFPKIQGHKGLVRLGTLKNMLGAEEADLVLTKLHDSELRHAKALRALGHSTFI